MLPFLCLLVLCGLLTQNVQGNGHPLAIANMSPQLLQQLISQRMDSQAMKEHLQNLPLEDVVRNGMKQGSGGGGLLSGLPILGGLVNNVVGGILGVRIKNVALLNLDVKLAEDETKIIVTIPADIEVEVKCPLNLLNRLLHLKLYLDIQVGVRIVKDPGTGHIRLTIENCQNNPGHLRITLLDKRLLGPGQTKDCRCPRGHFCCDCISPLFRLVNNIVRLVTDILEKTVPHLLQKELCPLANGLVQSVLDLLQGSLTSQVHGEMFNLSPESFRLQDGSLRLVYEMPGGQSVVIPQDFAPLPSIPLEGSLMNMVLSGNYLALAVQDLLHPQVLTIKDTLINQQIAAKLGSNVHTVQVALGAPALSLTPGKIHLWLPIELRVYTEHPTGAYGPRYTIKAKLILLVHPSIAVGKMIFTLHSERIEMDAADQHWMGMMRQMSSTYLVPHLNKLLAEGASIPLLKDLGLDSHVKNIAVGNGAMSIEIPGSAEMN